MATEQLLDLISRSALIAEYDRVHVGEPGGARKLMEAAPTMDAVEVVHGRWIIPKIPHITIVGICSECGKMGDRNYNFCPNCGADMRGEEDA